MVENIATPHTNPGDYIDNDGFLCCGKCGERKQMDIKVPERLKSGGRWRVRRPCACEREQIQHEQAEKKTTGF